MPQDPIREESRVLIAAAKRTGCFLERERIPGTRYTIRTGESEVRLVQVERMYYKIKNPFAKGHLKKHPARYALYEHIVHNVLFPECPIELLGITEDLHEARLSSGKGPCEAAEDLMTPRFPDGWRTLGWNPPNDTASEMPSCLSWMLDRTATMFSGIRRMRSSSSIRSLAFANRFAGDWSRWTFPSP